MCNFEAIGNMANSWYKTAINTLAEIDDRATNTCVKIFSSFVNEDTAKKIITIIKRVLASLPTVLCLSVLPTTHAYLLVPVYLIVASELRELNTPIGDGFGLYLGASAVYHLALCFFNPSLFHLSAVALLGSQAVVTSTIWDR